MNEIIENILTRRSVRSFNDKPVSKEDIELLLKTAIYAPSGSNKQTWNFFAVLNKEKIQNLIQVMEKALNKPGYKMCGPTAIIITTNERDSNYGHDDNSSAMQNMQLAGHSLGIGSVWINQLSNGNSDIPEIRAELTKLGIPENHLAFGVLALGYTDLEPRGIVEKTGKYFIIE
ncbi:MAG: nitroreductase family protein [Clostridia bacterium]